MISGCCKYAPAELFAGFSEKMERLDPHPVSFSCADGCAHPNLCGFAKAVIEEVKARGIRRLVLTDCCDAMRRTYDVLKGEGMDFLYLLPLPHRTGERELRYFAGQLMKLREAYADYSGRAFSEDAARAALASGSSFAETRGASGEIVLLGAHGGGEVRRLLEEAFPGYDVADRTCSGNRSFDRDMLRKLLSDRGGADPTGTGGGAAASENFFLRYAELLLKGLPPCMRMQDVSARAGLLTAGGAPGPETPADSAPGPGAQADGRGMSGIVYHTMRFCDYYGFEYAALRKSCSVPLLKIETDATPLSGGQMKTRIEAFAETVRGGYAPERKAGSGPAARFVAGIDSGSASTDAVVLDADQRIVGRAVIPTGMSASRSAGIALASALKEAGIREEDLARMVTTGYGRDTALRDVDASAPGKSGEQGAEDAGTPRQAVTEITCHAAGAHFLFPDVRTVIDIGGQDSKVIRLDEEGRVVTFVMNDKCAAGTGRFLEMQARALDITLDEMSRLGIAWKEEVRISSMCTVFAESEVVSLVARDTPLPDIIHGLNRAVAERTAALVRRCRGEGPFLMTGGVSKNAGVAEAIREALGEEVRVLPESQLCGAIGAALIAGG